MIVLNENSINKATEDNRLKSEGGYDMKKWKALLTGTMDRGDFACRIIPMEVLLIFLFGFGISMLGMARRGGIVYQVLFLGFVLAFLYVFFLELCYIAKRCRDMGLPGWIGPVVFIPADIFFYSTLAKVILLVLMVLPTNFFKEKHDFF